ncbi:hypothetical protein EJV47_06015 [Hymenobacter gummosus]|uniref:DUF2490 domain-containing protein n=1 Tax=Hymenobacter gummosus TaxID=1776032 RepID=A0A3S0H7Z6_9BACT|nr:hypothetical protein [Hymenobacter gummosus]RTQ52565.1 hypothetical protein EJV47_06015 [Hymenobacter gummosus]
MKATATRFWGKTALRWSGALLLLAAGPAWAQRPLLSTEVAEDTARQNYGPHRRHFRHLFASYTPVVGQPDGEAAELRPWASSEMAVGLREKLRLTRVLAVGADARYVYQRYSLAQNETKRLPDATLHHREALVLHRLDLEGWLRLRFGRQGNTVGRYVDVSGWGGWVAGTSHHAEDEPNSARARRVRVTETGLPYLRRWTYGAGARLGSQRLALTARYRLSDTFRKPWQSLYPELPRLTLGLEIGLL